MERKALFLVGPTGSGKSEVALALAQALKGEIISCDAMQVYKGMDIGTAKPPSAEQRKIPHHLIDLISPRSEHSVFKHRELALKAMVRIFSRNRLPIVVGGSGLYVKAIINGLAPLPGKRTLLRKKLEARARKKGPLSLYAELRKLAPKRASKIHPNDQKRIIRALEILYSSSPFPPQGAGGSVQNRALWTDPPRFLAEMGEDRGGGDSMALPPQPHLPPRGGKEFQKALEHLGIRPLIFGLLWDRKKLYERIEHRVDHMFETGWIGEVKRLAKTGFSKTAKAAIGYHEILKYLQNRCTLTEAESEIKKRTRHLAKKQMTWFRADQRISWIPVSGNRFVSHALRKIVQEFTAS